MARLAGVATLAYPLVLHICVSTDRLSIAIYYLSATLVLPLLANLVERKNASIIDLLCILLAVALFTVLSTYELLALKLLSVSIYAAMFGLFAGSLRPGETPIITQVAFAMRAKVVAAEIAYTRGATVAWAAFFLVMGIVSGLLSIFSSNEVWSWFVNIGSYFLVVLFFVLEFVYRRRVLGEIVDYSFGEFVLSLARPEVFRFFSVGRR